MGPSRNARGRRRAVGGACATVALILGPSAPVLASWPQFQGGPRHEGIGDGPAAPLAIGWRNDDVELRPSDASGGLSAPVVADDGTVVAVGPAEVVAFSSTDGSQRFSVERDLGPPVQPAIAGGPDGPIVVYTEGFGDRPPTGTATAASPSPSGDGDAAFDSHVNAIDLDGRTVWDEPAQLDAIVVAPVTVDDRTAYVADVDGTITALDLGTGEARWTAGVGSTVAGPATIVEDTVFVSAFGAQAGPGAVVALDAATGEERWRTSRDDVTGNLASTPIVTDEALVVLETSSVVALDPDRGSLRWRTEIVNPTRNPPFLPQGTATPVPVVVGDAVVALDASGRVYALDLGSGRIRWDHALNDASVLSVPVVAEDQVLVPSDSGTVHALDLAEGTLVWRLDVGAPLVRGLADAGDVLVAVTGFDDAGVVGLSSATGTLLAEPSPTTLDAGRLLAGFALGGVLLGAVAVLVARPLQRRLGPAGPFPVDDAAAEDG